VSLLVFVPTGPLFIPQVVHEHGERRGNNIDMGKLLTRSPEFSDNSTSNYLAAK
jgi:hypothetical protein